MARPIGIPRPARAILGLTRDSGVAHIVRAALESVAYQTADLADAFVADMRDGATAGELSTLRVDGGMVLNDWLCQFLADVLDRPVERPAVVETTALGAAYLAGLAAGVYGSLEEIAAAWRLERRFSRRWLRASGKGWSTDGIGQSHGSEAEPFSPCNGNRRWHVRLRTGPDREHEPWRQR